MRAPAAAIALSLAFAGCATEPQKPAADPAASQKAVAAAAAALEKDPLDPAKVRDLGRAELAAGRCGRAHALFLAAAWLLEHPAEGKAACPKDEVECDARAAERGGATPPAIAASPAMRERHARARAEALRLYDEKKYAQALEKLERLTADDPRASRFIASCHMKLAGQAADEGRLADAVERLWQAADADVAARAPVLYRDVARLERREASRHGAGDAAEAVAALRRALRAAPGEVETLYLLARRADLPPAEKAYYAGLLAKLHPNRAEAEFVDAARRVREAPDAAKAAAIADEFARANPAETALVADLRSLLAERSTGEAAKDAAAARARYDSAVEQAKKSRTAFETQLEPAVEGDDKPR